MKGQGGGIGEAFIISSFCMMKTLSHVCVRVSACMHVSLCICQYIPPMDMFGCIVSPKFIVDSSKLHTDTHTSPKYDLSSVWFDGTAEYIIYVMSWM